MRTADIYFLGETEANIEPTLTLSVSRIVLNGLRQCLHSFKDGRNAIIKSSTIIVNLDNVMTRQGNILW